MANFPWSAAPRIQAPATPARKAASQRTQRSPGRGRAQAPRPPGGQPQHGVQRAASRRAGNQHQHQQQRGGGAGKSLIQMTPAEVEAHARSIVSSELNAERLPFTQRQTSLTGEEQGQQQAHTTSYQQLDTGIAGQQTHAAESAKTAQNVAAEAVKRAESQAPGAEQAAEHGAGGEALAKQQAAAKTLLTAITTAAQAGTNARQQSEGDFLTNMRATAAQEGTTGTQRIAGEYGRRKQEVSDKQTNLEAGKAGRVGKLASSLLGEQEKLKIAAQGLGIKTVEAQRHAGEAQAKAQHTSRSDRLAERRVASEEAKNQTDAEYKRASLPAKERKDALDIKQKEAAIKKTLTNSPSGATPLTTNEVNELAAEGARAFNVVLRQHQKGMSFTKIREEAKLKQPVWLDVAQQIVEKGYVGAQTKQVLREMGLTDAGWSNRFWPERAAKTKPGTRGVPPNLPVRKK